MGGSQKTCDCLLPDPETWQWAGRVCPEQWLEAGLASSAEEGFLSRAAVALGLSQVGCDGPALLLLLLQMLPSVLEAWTVL